MEVTPMTVGEKIYKLRVYSGLSQKEFSDKVGASQSAINYWENGKRQPRVAQLKKIAKVFDFPLYLLLDDDYELGDVALEMKRAKPFKSYEMVEPPGPFTVPLSQYNHGNNIYKNLHEIALQKELNREPSTDEKEQASIDIPVRSRKRANAEDTNYDPLSYENSYSFASSEEEFNKLQKERQIKLEGENNNFFHKYDGSIRVNPNSEREKLDEEAQKIIIKQASGKEITEEEAQKVSDYIERTREDYDKLSESIKNLAKVLGKYLNESTQISRENFQLLKEKLQILTDMIPTMPDFYENLNDIGRKKAAEQIDLLTKIPEYQKKPDELPEE